MAVILQYFYLELLYVWCNSNDSLSELHIARRPKCHVFSIWQIEFFPLSL